MFRHPTVGAVRAHAKPQPIRKLRAMLERERTYFM